MADARSFYDHLSLKWAQLLQLKGVRGIQGVTVRQEIAPAIEEATDQMQVDRREWMLETSGSNLAAVLQIYEVDHRRTRSNHVLEMERVFGIEAAIATFGSEILDVLQGSNIDERVRVLLFAVVLIAV